MSLALPGNANWPSSWPTDTTENELVGLGRASTVAKSAKILDWQLEDTCGTFQPYVVVPLLPFTLWGRDVLSQMGVLLFSPDDKVTSQMLQMGYDPSKGLGKQQTGIIEPICPAPRQLLLDWVIQIYNGGHCFCC